MTPAERSNSPPIIRRATGTATIPYCAAWSVHPAAIPGSPIQFTERAKYPNAKKTAIAPRNAPMSGRVSSRASGPTRTWRSSGATFGAAVWAISALRFGWGRPAKAAPNCFLASALRCERGHLGSVRLVDDAGAGQHRRTVSDGVEVRCEEDCEHDGQIPLQVLLLVDREQHLAGLDLLDRSTDVERSYLRAARDRREARDRHVRVEPQETVQALVRIERCLHLRFRPRNVGLRVRDRQDLDLACTEDRLDARRTLLESRVARLVDDDQHLLGTGLLELLAGTLTRNVLRLPDMHLVCGQRVEGTEPRVDGDDLDSLVRGFAQGVLECACVGHRGRDHLGAAGDRGVDPRNLLRHVVVRIDLGHAHPPRLQILLGLVDALLENRPERARVAVCHDSNLDRCRVARRQRRGHGRAEYRETGCRGAPCEEQPLPCEQGLLLVDEVLVHASPFPVGCCDDSQPFGGAGASPTSSIATGRRSARDRSAASATARAARASASEQGLCAPVRTVSTKAASSLR